MEPTVCVKWAVCCVQFAVQCVVGTVQCVRAQRHNIHGEASGYREATRKMG